MFKKILLFISLINTDIFGNFISQNIINGVNSTLQGIPKFIVSQTLDNNGLISNKTSLYIECGKIIGNGKIQSPNIEIIAHEFNFTGIIECNKVCKITTSKEIKQSNFKQVGKGKFIFKINPALKLPNVTETKDQDDNKDNDKYKPYSFWWEEINKTKTNVKLEQFYKYYRLLLQININEKECDPKNFEMIKNIAKDIRSFIRFESKFSFNPVQKLYDLIEKLPLKEIEENKIKGIKCSNLIKVVNALNIDTKIDNDVDLSDISIGLFLMFDSNNLGLNELFSEKVISTSIAKNLFFYNLDKSLYMHCYTYNKY